MELRGAVVVVTGASSGFGELAALRFGRAGSTVVLAARRADRLEDVARRIRERGGTADPVVCDVADLASIDGLVRAVREHHGRIDVLVNNAGIPGGGGFEGLSAEQIERVIRVNVLGVLQTTRAFLPMFLERGRGHVVNVASLAGRFATPGHSVYTASKHAVVAFGEAVAYELETKGIRVTSVNPGFAVTEGFPQSGLPKALVLDADHVAEVIVDVVRRDAGPEISVPRGMSFFQVFRILTPGAYRAVIRRIARRLRPTAAR